MPAADNKPGISVSPLISDEYADTDGIAVELGVTARTVVRWRLEGGGPPVTRMGRLVRYRRESARKWLLAQEAKWLRAQGARAE
jgi:hypothetical protein